jgi:hypothetical protein
VEAEDDDVGANVTHANGVAPLGRKHSRGHRGRAFASGSVGGFRVWFFSLKPRRRGTLDLEVVLAGTLS